MRFKKKKITPKEMLSSNKCGLQKHALPECIQPNKWGWNVFVGSLFFARGKVEVSPNSAGFIHWEPLMSSSSCWDISFWTKVVVM